MKKLILFLVLFSASAFASLYKIDNTHSNVGFTIKHLVSKVNGEFTEYEGKFIFDEAKKELKDIDVTIKADSIFTRNQKRDEHLKSPEFFNKAKNPTLTFKSNKPVKLTGKKAKLTGDLTINGVTKPVTLDVEFLGTATDPWGNEIASFSATTKINRKDFNMSWNKTLDKGGLVLGEDVDIVLNIEAQKQKEEAKH